MTVKITTRQTGAVTVVDLDGRITIGPTANEFGEKIRELTASGEKQLVLNLAELSYVDSCGIGALVASYSSLAKAGGVLRLLNPQKRVRELLDITHVSSLFQIFDNEAAAVGSFGS